MGLPADPFDEVFRTEGIDPLLILGRRHLERVLAEFAGHFNAEQRYRGLWLTRPFPSNVIEFLGQRREPEARPIGRDDSRVPPRSSVTEYLYPSGRHKRALNQRTWSKRRMRIWSERFRVTGGRAYPYGNAARRRST